MALPLHARLSGPAADTDIEGLLARWFQTDILFSLPDRPGILKDPAVPDHMRGALGQALLETASEEAQAGHPCPWSPPCALEILWGDMPPVRPGVPVPKPFALALEPGPEAGRVTLRLSLFGFASDQAEAVAEALTRILRAGVAPRPGPPTPWRPLDRKIVTLDPPDLLTIPREAKGIALCFETPFIARGLEPPTGGSGPSLTATKLLTGLSRRAEGFARWHDLDLWIDGDRLASIAAGLTVDLSTMTPIRWQRPTTRGQKKPLWRDGLCGVLRLSGPGDLLQESLLGAMPLLVLGQRIGAGSHVNQGAGRYQLDHHMLR